MFFVIFNFFPNHFKNRTYKRENYYLQTSTLSSNLLEYASIFEQFDDFIAIINVEDRIIAYANQKVVEMYDLKSKYDIIGKKIPDFRKYSLTVEKVNEIFDYVLSGNTYKEEVEYRTAEGREFIGLLRVMTIAIGYKDYIIYKITDITEIKKIEYENKLNNQRLRFAIEGNGCGLWEWNIPSNKTFFSKRWKAMLGYEDNEIGNNFESWRKLLHPDDIENTQKKVNHYLTHFKEENYDIEFRMLCKNGKYKWINARGMVVKSDINDNPINFVGTHSDIDKLKNIQEDLQLYASRLEKSNADIKQFAYITTHDLKEPLRTISNNIQLLKIKNEHDLNEDSIKLIDYSIEGCKKLMGIIKELLEYAQLEIGEEDREPLDLNQIVNQVKDNIQYCINNKNALIEIQLLPSRVFGNKHQFARLFQNMISNAIKYNDSKQPIIKLSSCIKDNRYIIHISDNGIGISNEYRHKIYDIFKRLKTDTDSESVGMGLAVCKKIIEAHKGSLWHESIVGQGTTFSFSLPI